MGSDDSRQQKKSTIILACIDRPQWTGVILFGRIPGYRANAAGIRKRFYVNERDLPLTCVRDIVGTNGIVRTKRSNSHSIHLVS